MYLTGELGVSRLSTFMDGSSHCVSLPLRAPSFVLLCGLGLAFRSPSPHGASVVSVASLTIPALASLVVLSPLLDRYQGMSLNLFDSIALPDSRAFFQPSRSASCSALFKSLTVRMTISTQQSASCR